MKAALLTELKKLEIKNVPDPVIKNDNDVLIQIDAVGVCGSDVHYYRTGNIGSQVVDFPFTRGHECSGGIRYEPRGGGGGLRERMIE